MGTKASFVARPGETEQWKFVDMHETQIFGRYLLCLWDWSAPQITNPDSDLSGQGTFEAPGSAPIGTSLVHGAT